MSSGKKHGKNHSDSVMSYENCWRAVTLMFGAELWKERGHKYSLDSTGVLYSATTRWISCFRLRSLVIFVWRIGTLAVHVALKL